MPAMAATPSKKEDEWMDEDILSGVGTMVSPETPGSDLQALH